MTKANHYNGNLPHEVWIERDRVLCHPTIKDKDGRVVGQNPDAFYHFFLLAWHTVEKDVLVDGFHIRLICRRLQEETERIAAGKPKTKDLIICIPPRMSKSSIVAVMWNAWTWTVFPELRFVTCSYSGPLAEKHSLKTKRCLNSPWYRARWDVELATDKNTNKEYYTTSGGMRFATSVGATVTGEGGDILIGDDLINVGDSKSEAKRATSISFYKDTLFNRLNTPEVGLRVLMQQRTHDADVVGTLLEENPDGYDKIILPAELRPDVEVQPSEARDFYVDDLLDHTRLPRHVLEDYETTMNDYSEQYLQDCKKPGGNIIQARKWIKSFKVADLYRMAMEDGESLTWYYVIDGAFTKNHDNDPSVCFCYAYFRNQWWIKDILRVHASFTELLPKINSFVRSTGYGQGSLIRIEPKANGLDLIDGLRVYHGLNALASFNPTLDKIAMAHGITPELMSGRVHMADDCTDKEAAFKEFELFPKAKHDDRVDCLIMMIKNGAGGSFMATGRT